MARPIVLGNGELHVGINAFGLVHDFYYPYVGFENHSADKQTRHRVGVWVDGVTSWLDDGDWSLDFTYPHESLIGHTVARNKKLNIILEFDDSVDAEFSAFMRNIHIVNTANSTRDVRLFMHQAFKIGDSASNTDTAQYLPDVKAVLHYRGRRAFVISGQTGSGEYFDQHSIGLFGIEGREGTYRDADDGELSMSNVEHGRVDSTLRFSYSLKPLSSERAHYWVACGTSIREALYIHKQLTTHGVNRRQTTTAKWWQNWLKPAQSEAAKLPVEHRGNFLRSLMIIKSHIDKRGAVIASTDSAMLKYWRDAYAYCWPRDAALVLWPLIRLGYKDEPYRFFDFCRRVMSPGGYVMHKYRADSALGSSWHPYIHEDGATAPPIQEDETALVLFMFSQYYHAQNNPALLKEFYTPLVEPMANFMATYIDHRTNLPRASYDLWEENFATSSFTTAVVYSALEAAADLADILKDSDSAVKWRSAAESIQEAAHKHLVSSSGVITKSVSVAQDGEVSYDHTVDASSFYGGFMFGLFDINSKEVTATAAAVQNVLRSNGVGVIRYENDNYRRTEGSASNPWIITTLWLAQYNLEQGNREQALEALDWVHQNAWATAALPEQLDSSTNKESSVSPLCWSQAEYVSTLLDTIQGKTK